MTFVEKSDIQSNQFVFSVLGTIVARHIFITGGVLSSLGKGIASASLGALLISRGYSVRLRKFEPYLNVDPGTMSPNQHGEVYVTEDGAETDLDLGHYERFTGVATRASDAVTTGQIYSQLIAKERRGDYLGATVQVIPHVTNLIQYHFQADIDDDTDFVICEIGGTVGDIESLPFVEAVRQFMYKVGREKAMLIHLTLLPYIASSEELKTKPAQHSVKQLQQLGVQPDILLCRCDRPIPNEAKEKLALFCNLNAEKIIEAIDVDTIYRVTLEYSTQGLDTEVLKHFKLDPKAADLSLWQNIVQRVKNPVSEVNIAIVAKYMTLRDAYKSLIEACVHAGIHHKVKVNIQWVDAESLESDGKSKPVDEIKYLFASCHGIIVPGGYGHRGIEGKIAAIRYAREFKVPFMGICLGMQLAAVESARNVAGLKDANSTEFGPTANPVVALITEWNKDGLLFHRSDSSDLGGTMRLGSYASNLVSNSLIHDLYNQDIINERHRHRYELNTNYRKILEKAGLRISGVSTAEDLPSVIERPDHPWFVGVQFHPELKSYPFKPSPLFIGFINAAMNHKD